MLRSLKGTNALTVLFAPAREEQQTKMFFCPYRKNIVGSYQGEVLSIMPGYDPNITPQFFVRPQRQAHADNIHYVFTPSGKTSKEEPVLFWIQDQYFDQPSFRLYSCFNCQAPQLYFNEEKALSYESRKEIESNTTYVCNNCKTSLTYMGIVKIKKPEIQI